MSKKNLVFGMAILVGLLSIVSTIIPIQNSAWRATKICNFTSPFFRIGTYSGDRVTDLVSTSRNSSHSADVRF